MGARNRDAAVAASWQQHHRSLFAPRRSAGTAAAARSCGVAAATATMCAEHSRNDVRCRCAPHKAYSVAPSHLRFAPSSIARSAHSVAPSHLQSLFEGWHGVVVRSLDRQGTGAAHSSGHSTSAEFGQVYGTARVVKTLKKTVPNKVVPNRDQTFASTD